MNDKHEDYKEGAKTKEFEALVLLPFIGNNHEILHRLSIIVYNMCRVCVLREICIAA